MGTLFIQKPAVLHPQLTTVSTLGGGRKDSILTGTSKTVDSPTFAVEESNFDKTNTDLKILKSKEF